MAWPALGLACSSLQSAGLLGQGIRTTYLPSQPSPPRPQTSGLCATLRIPPSSVTTWLTLLSSLIHTKLAKMYASHSRSCTSLFPCSIDNRSLLRYTIQFVLTFGGLPVGGGVRPLRDGDVVRPFPPGLPFANILQQSQDGLTQPSPCLLSPLHCILHLSPFLGPPPNAGRPTLPSPAHTHRAVCLTHPPRLLFRGPVKSDPAVRACRRAHRESTDCWAPDPRAAAPFPLCPAEFR